MKEGYKTKLLIDIGQVFSASNCVSDVFFGWKSESKLQVSAWFGDATDVQLRKDITEEAFKKKTW